MMPSEPTGPRSADLDWCRSAMADVSRTFAITVDRLAEPMASHVCVGYLCCRVADTIEDAGHLSLSERAAALARYDRVLDPTDGYDGADFLTAVSPLIPTDPDGKRSPDWVSVAESPRVIRTFEALAREPRERMRPPIRELVGGMAMFADRYADDGSVRLRTIAELEEYCWYVAGTVGTLVTELVTRDVEEWRARALAANARSFSMLLQLVNVAKDAASDYRDRGDVYLPAAWLADEGIDPSDIAAESNRLAVARVVRRLADHAADYLDDAQRYLELLPERHGNRLAAWAIPYLLAVGTIRELRRRPSDGVRDGDLKVSREEVYALIRRFDEGVDRAELADLRAEMAEHPLHR
ncbi:phytoene/squalene synthase family protein [Halovivax sp.]|uniref:phytoene/squalene synthase family protein n=1 Tax=Halovivax sp. TaxID=1935978 RepID=UPI0025BA41A2|nr:phytoene/squalene synthase family protein [Halovivax sp.]